MQLDKNTGIIIQARSGSFRLPQKMLLPFYKEETLLDVVICSLVSFFGKENIIVATSATSEDDRIKSQSLKHGVRVFRGDEQNVLGRFIQAAEENNIEVIIRVCGDNPFIQTEYIVNLINEFNQSNVDYISYGLNDGTPAVRTHFGFFTEIVTRKALKKAALLTSDKIHTEHVTNYIYTHPDIFKVRFINIPEYLEERKNIRLTIDTKADFDICAEIYSQLKKNKKEMKVSEILSIIDKKSDLLKIMNNEIKRNQK